MRRRITLATKVSAGAATTNAVLEGNTLGAGKGGANPRRSVVPEGPKRKSMAERIDEIQSDEEQPQRVVVEVSSREVFQKQESHCQQDRAREDAAEAASEVYGPMTTPKAGPPPRPKQRPRTYGTLGVVKEDKVNKDDENVEFNLRGRLRLRSKEEVGGSSASTANVAREGVGYGYRDPRAQEPRRSSSRSSGRGHVRGSSRSSDRSENRGTPPESSSEVSIPEDPELVRMQVMQLMPRPYVYYYPVFEENLVYTNLYNETMEDLLTRVHKNWPGELQHCIPDGLAPRLLHCPEDGKEDGYFSVTTVEGLKIEVRVHRKPRRKFFDVSQQATRDPWTKFSITLMFYDVGDRTIVVQPRKGNRMGVAVNSWRGYTLFFVDTSKEYAPVDM